MRLLARILSAAAVAVSLMTVQAVAVQPDEMLQDQALETRARTLSRELRCMVCQNQSIDDSDAPLARDLRLLVRERLTKGDSDQQVLDFLVARYGEFVLLKPRFEWRTLVLWVTPPGVVIVGLVALYVFSRKRRQPGVHNVPLTPQERDKIAKLTGGAAGNDN
jgi:cytochrome c-type biogenesis protein CcmH